MKQYKFLWKYSTFCRYNIDTSASHFFRRQMKFWGKVIFLQAFVCPRGEGVSLTETLLNRDLKDRDPQIETHWTEMPPGQRPPWTETPPNGKERTVRILLECILVKFCFLFLSEMGAIRALVSGIVSTEIMTRRQTVGCYPATTSECLWT